MKAVIPAAGLGTRLLPATKSMPKEMLPVVDRPVIQYVVEEAVESGIDDILIVTGRGKRAIEDHFDRSFELEERLEAAGKTDLLDRVRDVTELARIHYVRQAEPRGLGDAVLCARRFVGDEPFAVLLGDDIVLGDDGPVTRNLADLHEEMDGASAFSVMEVPQDEVARYGCLDGEPVEDRKDVWRVRGIVEKPDPADAPSNRVAIGRYVFEPAIFDHLDKVGPGVQGEVQLSDAMATLAAEREMYALDLHGTRLDVGTVEGFVEANVAMAMRRDDLEPGLAERLRRALGAD